MTIEEMQEKYEDEIAELKNQYDSIPDIACVHFVCDECRMRMDRDAQTRNALSIVINEKSEVLNNLLSIK